MFLTIFLAYYNFILTFFNLFEQQVYYYLIFFFNHFQKNIIILGTALESFSFLTWNLYNYFFFLNPKLIFSKNLTIEPSLLLGFYNLHPLLLYFVLLVAFCEFCLLSNELFFLNRICFVISTTTLILGGLWGSGNSIWGYFWVNDIIEQLLFAVCVLFVIRLHTYTHFWYDKNYFVSLLLIVLVLLIIRCGFVFSRHSFFDANSVKNSVGLITSFYTTEYLFLFTTKIVWACKWYAICLVLNMFLKNVLVHYLIFFKLFYTHIIFFIISLCWLKTTAHNFYIFSNSVENIIKQNTHLFLTWTDSFFVFFHTQIFSLFHFKVFKYLTWKNVGNKLFYSPYVNFLLLYFLIIWLL